MLKGSGLMLQIVGIVISSFFLNISQPLTTNNGWKTLSVASASSHCACGCCGGKVCHCGMENTTQAPVSFASPQSSSRNLPPCCGKTKHLPEQGNTSGLISIASSFNELQKNLDRGDGTIPNLSLSKNQIHSFFIAFSPGIHFPSYFPLRI